MSKKKDNNILDYTPIPVTNLNWNVNEKKRIVLERRNRGFFNWMTQKLYHKPKITYVELEEYGSFIWPLIDGHNTIYEIGKKVQKKFGDSCEPLYERLVSYFYSLQNNKFILLKKI